MQIRVYQSRQITSVCGDDFTVIFNNFIISLLVAGSSHLPQAMVLANYWRSRMISVCLQKGVANVKHVDQSSSDRAGSHRCWYSHDDRAGRAGVIIEQHVEAFRGDGALLA